MEELDSLDLAILHELQTDCARSVQEIGEQVGLSQSPCWRRIRRLEGAGDEDVADRRAQLAEGWTAWGKVALRLEDKPKAIDLTKLAKPGVKHQLVMRVVKKSFAAGIKGRVRLMESLRIVGDR